MKPKMNHSKRRRILRELARSLRQCSAAAHLSGTSTTHRCGMALGHRGAHRICGREVSR